MSVRRRKGGWQAEEERERAGREEKSQAWVWGESAILWPHKTQRFHNRHTRILN